MTRTRPPKGLAVTFITDYGLEPLEGSRDEVARLAEAMRQISVLASLNDSNERVWVQDVAVGSAIVSSVSVPGDKRAFASSATNRTFPLTVILALSGRRS